MPQLWVNAEYSIYQVQHYFLMPSPPLTASISSLGWYCTQLSTVPQLHINQSIVSQLPSYLPSNQPPPSTSPISLDHSLEVHVQTGSVIASKCISEFTQSQHLSTTPILLNHGLKAHQWATSIPISNCIIKFARWWRQSASLSSIDLGLQVHLLCPHDLSLQVHLETRSITASLCIINHDWSQCRSSSLSSHDLGLPVHHETSSITACKYIINEWWWVYGGRGVKDV